MNLQALAAIIGILSGLVTLVGGAAGALERVRRPAPALAPRVPVHAGAYPPPASNVSGPYPQPGNARPPQGYGWPATPPPPAGPAQRGYPRQPSTPPPQPGYGAPPGQWSNAPRPAAPYPTPQQMPYAQHAPQLRSRRWFAYPTIAVYAAIALVSSGLIGILSPSGLESSTSSASSAPPPSAALTAFIALLTLILIAAYVISVVLAARQAIR
ncbi:MAG: hypothetical protein ACRDHP_04270, partial [Ktedonobacterales bacterium]